MFTLFRKVLFFFFSWGDKVNFQQPVFLNKTPTVFILSSFFTFLRNLLVLLILINIVFTSKWTFLTCTLYKKRILFHVCCFPVFKCILWTSLIGYFVAPLPIQPQERPHPQVPPQPIRCQLCLKSKVSLRQVPTPRRGGGEGRVLPSWSQSVWRWRVRGRREALDPSSVF